MIEGSKKAVLIISEASPEQMSQSAFEKFYSTYFSMVPLRVEESKFSKFYREKVTLPAFAKERLKNYKYCNFDGAMAGNTAAEALRYELERQVKVPVYSAFLNSQNSIQNSLTEAYAKGAENLLIIPLFPFYTILDYDRSLIEVFKFAGDKYPDLNLVVIPPFYQHRGFIKSLEELIRDQNSMFGVSHLHIIFRGLPADLVPEKDLDGQPSYRNQANAFTAVLKEKIADLGLEFSYSFLPSKLGNRKYIGPNSFDQVKKLLAEGVRNITFISPTSIIDNIETLYDLEVEFKSYANKLPFDQVNFIPSLNNHPVWISELSRWIDEWLFSPINQNE